MSDNKKGLRMRTIRNQPFCWQEKKILRLLRGNFNKNQLAKLRCLYGSITEIDSDFHQQDIKYYTKTIHTYSGLPIEWIPTGLKILQDLQIIQIVENRENGKFQGKTLVFTPDNVPELPRKTVKGKTLIGKNLNGFSDTSEHSTLLEHSINNLPTEDNKTDSKESAHDPENINTINNSNPISLIGKKIKIIKTAAAAGGWPHRIDPDNPTKLVLKATKYIKALLDGTMFNNRELNTSYITPGTIPSGPLSEDELSNLFQKAIVGWLEIKETGAAWAKKLSFPDWIYNPRSKQSQFLNCLSKKPKEDYKGKLANIKAKLSKQVRMSADTLIYQTKRFMNNQENYEYWRSIRDIDVWSRESHKKLTMINRYHSAYKASLCTTEGLLRAYCEYLNTWKTWNPASISPGKGIWNSFVQWIKAKKGVVLDLTAKVPKKKSEIKSKVEENVYQFQQIKPEEAGRHAEEVRRIEANNPGIAWMDAQEQAAEVVISRRKTG